MNTLVEQASSCNAAAVQTFINVLNGVQIFKNQGDCVSFVATQEPAC